MSKYRELWRLLISANRPNNSVFVRSVFQRPDLPDPPPEFKRGALSMRQHRGVTIKNRCRPPDAILVSADWCDLDKCATDPRLASEMRVGRVKHPGALVNRCRSSARHAKLQRSRGCSLFAANFGCRVEANRIRRQRVAVRRKHNISKPAAAVLSIEYKRQGCAVGR